MTPPVVAQARPIGKPHRPDRAGPVPYLFLLPAIAFFVGLIALPAAYAAWLSTRSSKVSGSGLVRGARREVYVGFRNYRTALHDPELWHSMLRLLLYICIVVPIMLSLALLFALIIDSSVARLRRFSRIAIFMPYAVPSVVATVIWGFLYLPGVSPLRYAEKHTGIPVTNFFAPHAIFGSVANIAIWGGTGFNMIVLYTALRAIPPELYDSARVDGCNEFQIAVRVKVPLVLPAFILTIVFSVIATLQVFNEPTALQPLANTIPSTWMPLMTVYRDAFTNDNLYAGAATSIIFAVFTTIISFGLLRLVQRRAFGEPA